MWNKRIERKFAKYLQIVTQWIEIFRDFEAWNGFDSLPKSICWFWLSNSKIEANVIEFWSKSHGIRSTGRKIVKIGLAIWNSSSFDQNWIFPFTQKWFEGDIRVKQCIEHLISHGMLSLSSEQQ